jgi:hypothetical protein
LHSSPPKKLHRRYLPFLLGSAILYINTNQIRALLPSKAFLLFLIVDFILEACYNPCQEVIYNGI